MKRIIKQLVVTLLMLLCLSILVSCGGSGDGEGTESGVFYTVTFDAAGGSAIGVQTVGEGKYATEPIEPIREGYIFDGWKKKGETMSWTFSYNKITEDTVLVAQWLEADQVFECQRIEGTDTAMITDLLVTKSVIRVPTAIKGWTVVGIADRVFADTNSEEIASIYLPESVTVIGEAAFANSSGVEITVSGALTFVGEGAFMNCDGLRSVTFSDSPDAIDYVPFEAFRGCTGLREITLPKNYLLVDETAFSGCSSLERLTVLHPECIIAHSAFEKCENLAVVYYGGSEAQLDEFLTVCVASGNNAITKNANLYVYSASEPKGKSDYNGYWHYTEDGKIRLWS